MTDDLREKVEGAATATMRALVDAHVRTWGTIVNQDKVLCGYSVSPEMVRELRSAVSAQVATLLDEQAERLARAEAERDHWEDQAAELALACNAVDAKLAKATAVIEAAERMRSGSNVHWRNSQQINATFITADVDAFVEAIANYHAGPAETETPGEP